MAFSNDGAKMFVVGSNGDDVNEYDLSTSFDASTAVFVDATSVSSQETDPSGIAFSNDGAKMFVIGSSSDNVNEYDLSAPSMPPRPSSPTSPSPSRGRKLLQKIWRSQTTAPRCSWWVLLETP